MRAKLVVLICDDTRDLDGKTWRAEGIAFKGAEVPIWLEFDKGLPMSLIGRAKLTLDGGVVIADCSWLDQRLTPNNSTRALFPVIGGHIDKYDPEKKQVSKATISDIHFTIMRPKDQRIGTLYQQGVRG